MSTTCKTHNEVPLALAGGREKNPSPLNVPEASLFSEQHWGLGASLGLSLQAPPGFPERRCDWQEAGYPQGNPSSRLGDPHCRLLLNSAGNQSWQPPVGGQSRFPWQPSAASSWLGREGSKPAEIAVEGLAQAATLVCWGKTLMTPPSKPGWVVTETRFSPAFKEGPIPFKGRTSLEPQSLVNYTQGKDMLPPGSSSCYLRY